MLRTQQVIKVISLAAWAIEYKDQQKWGECLERMPSALLDQWKEVVDGRVFLQTPEGREWWVPVWGRPDDPRISGDTATALFDYVLDHMTATHPGTSSSLPILFFDRATLAPSSVFCAECIRFINLSDDAKIYDGQHNRGWDE